MDQVDTGLIAEFVVESQEGLANIEQQMLAIEAAGANVDIDLVNAVFRTMHTIKGTAGFLGLDQIGLLAHGLEEVLNGMRNREIATSSELVTTVLKAADFMKGLIDAVDSSNEADITQHVTLLNQFRPGVTPHVEATAPQLVQSTVITQSAAATGGGTDNSNAMREFLIECHDKLDQLQQQLATLIATTGDEALFRSLIRTNHAINNGAGLLGLNILEGLTQSTDIILRSLRDGRLCATAETVNTLLATMDKCREALCLVETNGSDAGFDADVLLQRLTDIHRESSPPQQPQGEQSTHSETVSTNLGTVPSAPRAAAGLTTSTESVEAVEAVKPVTTPATDGSTPDKASGMTVDSTIRVDVGLLDKLMTRVGELVLARNQIVQFTSRLGDTSFISTAQRLNLITTELQESVMKTRMQPIGNVWAKFPRVVRDLSSQLGKQVRIEMEGKETELDKTIVEAIKDPLTHLVRNSVDHGIESPEVRQANGKPSEGCLLLRAYHEGGQVNIEITDDGAGLNLDRIRKKAVERGILSADQAARISDRDASLLIFAPGFSTAEKVTSVSGRGVGMDVVKTNIERISGTIDLQSCPGQGTTVRIKIPLTLAIIPALVVTNDGDRYAIPQVSLLELVRLDGTEAKSRIEYVHGAPVYRLRGKLLPLVYLSERLEVSKDSTGTTATNYDDGVINIVVLRANDRQFGLVVDKVNDTEEIVVKPLSRQLKGLSEFAGATIMGDGTIALILDVMGLAVAAGLAGELREQSLVANAKSESQSGKQIETLLVVDLGDSRRFALPTSMISRLEKVPCSAIEYADGREVIQYRGEILPLMRLSEVFGVSTPDDLAQEEYQVIVYAEEGYRCGLIVNRIVDIVETELNISHSRGDDANLLGTSIIQQRVTDVLNLRRLARRPATPKFLSK